MDKNLEEKLIVVVYILLLAYSIYAVFIKKW